MLTNIIRAKVSTHSLAVGVCVLVFATQHYFSEPHAAAWLSSRWALKDAIETAEAVLIAFGVYKQPTAPSA